MDRRVGLISDTHGRLDPLALALLAGVEHVVHAGDVGDPAILDELGTVAPVTAVLGNCDGADLDALLPEVAVVEVAGVRILACHIVGSGRAHEPSAALVRRAEEVGARVVVFGHSHRPDGWRDAAGVLWLNPGSASDGRGHPRAVAILEVAADSSLSVTWWGLDGAPLPLAVR